LNDVMLLMQKKTWTNIRCNSIVNDDDRKAICNTTKIKKRGNMIMEKSGLRKPSVVKFG